MIPTSLSILVEKQSGNVHRSNLSAVEFALTELKIPLDSEFAKFFLTYTITLYKSSVSAEQLCDIADPTPEIAFGTRYVHDVWELPEQYICISSIQGEGAYLYDVKTGKVWDFDLASREAFVSGLQRENWNSFYDFMIWYLSDTSSVS
jgi:hypothetical protein